MRCSCRQAVAQGRFSVNCGTKLAARGRDLAMRCASPFGDDVETFPDSGRAHDVIIGKGRERRQPVKVHHFGATRTDRYAIPLWCRATTGKQSGATRKRPTSLFVFGVAEALERRARCPPTAQRNSAPFFDFRVSTPRGRSSQWSGLAVQCMMLPNSANGLNCGAMTETLHWAHSIVRDGPLGVLQRQAGQKC